MSSSLTTSEWLDRFFDWHFRTNPVSATFIGVHQYDSELPAFPTTDRELDELLKESDRLSETSDLAWPDEVDLTLGRSMLQFARKEQQSGHLHRNPCLYTGEAIFGVVSLFLREFAPLDVRIRSATSRLNAVPELLSSGSASIAGAPGPWVERAIAECEGAERLLRDGLPQFQGGDPRSDREIRAAIDAALAAFRQFRSGLESTRDGDPDVPVAIGQELFDWMLREVHFLEMTGDQITEYARAELERARTELEAELRQQGFADWAAAVTAIGDDHPPAERYIESFDDVYDRARRHATDHDLVTWPDFPIEFEPIPEWAREAAPYLYFLYYRCPPPYDDGQVQRYLVPPLGDDPARVLRAVNLSQITVNHVIHHAGIGHHVQNWYAARGRSRVGQVAGNDTALRIAMSSAGTLVEGWACYATDLMEETGFLSPLQRLSMRQSRLRMAARAIVDVELHAGRFSFDDAVAFYVGETGMDPGAAKGEATKNSMFPTMAMMYLIGTDLIHDLRGDMQRRWGADFSLRRFHDAFLSYGAIPVALIRRLMRGEPMTPDRFSAEWNRP